MPGITGIISKSPDVEKKIDKMVACMIHEPFYNFGKYINPEIGIFSAWVCHDNSFCSCLPVWNETKEICIIFSGEDFADPSQLELLKNKGHKFYAENASYLVHLYEEYGEKFIGKLNGWFCGLIIDLCKKNIFLFNDRYGLGRIYYYENESGFYFSSEAKSLLKILPKLRQLNYASLGEIFSCGCVLQNRTLFEKVNILPSGSLWRFDRYNNLKKGKYFIHEEWENQSLLNGEEFYEKLKSTFRRIIIKYFRGKRRIAMSLTGGMDGRMIMAWANQPPGSLPCYTFGGGYRDCVDVKIARKIAKACGQRHQTIYYGDQFFDNFQKLSEDVVFVSDGTMDVSGSVELHINRVANQIAPVRMTGNYGSEILRGLVTFRPGALNWRFLDGELKRHIEKAKITYYNERQINRMSFIAFRQVPWHHFSRLSLEQSQITIRSPYLDNEIVSLMYQAPKDFALSNIPSLRLIADGNVELASMPTDRGLLYQPLPIITKLKHLYQEFTFKAEYAYDYGMPQWLAAVDRIFAPLHLEKQFLGRHKFYHFRIWYRDRLSKYLKEILLDYRTLNRPYVDGKRLEEIVLSHIKGTGNFTTELHKALTVELIQRQLIEMK